MSKIVLFFLTIFCLVFGMSAQTAFAEVGIPVRLKIQKIKVNAAIENVGLIADGSMGTPKLPRNAAWFELGPRPGENGSAVIAGHINWWNGAVSVFAKLNKLKLGDKAVVQDNQGQLITFIVSKVRMYDLTEDATDVFQTNDGTARLNLITCGGTWNKITRRYSKRLVVFMEKE